KALVAITGKSLERRDLQPVPQPAPGAPQVFRFSTCDDARQKAGLGRIRALPAQNYRGLRLRKEDELTNGLSLGETLLVEKDRVIVGFAICHTPGVSEAPHGSLYVKYGAIDPVRRRPEHFAQLLTACEEYGVAAGCQRIIVPVYTAYWRA